MGTLPPKSRDRWVTIPRLGPTRGGQAPATAIQVFYDQDGDQSSTASIFIEDEMDNGPIPTGVLDANGEQVFRIPWRDRLPVGFHYTPDQYDEDGDFIDYIVYEE